MSSEVEPKEKTEDKSSKRKIVVNKSSKANCQMNATTSLSVVGSSKLLPESQDFYENPLTLSVDDITSSNFIQVVISQTNSAFEKKSDAREGQTVGGRHRHHGKGDKLSEVLPEHQAARPVESIQLSQEVLSVDVLPTLHRGSVCLQIQ